ncbi:hypothetical protein C1D09_018870 [Mesorhizobium intechi]|uniref:hypothetical protein n=1 Tax=Mesorhizobium intechi TaxID=537601 RepID=UPI000CCAC621|nr:hypothetical protein [Mesorhizobium intechi]TSE07594.1 hypothetical protein C1D09_018870 [Mesorhizobium intechi]
MSANDQLPSLLQVFGPGRVPAEFRQALHSAEIEADLAAGIDISGGRDTSDGAPSRGVDLVSEQLLSELRRLKANQTSDGRASVNWQAFALLMACVGEGKAPPASLMRLIFECLDGVEGKPPPDVCEKFRWPSVDDWARWDAVVQADAKAIAATGSAATEYSLAKLTGVSRKTINRWRQAASYQNRRSFAVYLLSAHSGDL